MHTYIHMTILKMDGVFILILGSFEKLRNATISFVMSVRLSVRPPLRVKKTRPQ